MPVYRSTQTTVRPSPDRELDAKPRPSNHASSDVNRSPKAYRFPEAARMLSVSEDWFRANVVPEVRVITQGRMRLVPSFEIDRWLEENATRS